MVHIYDSNPKISDYYRCYLFIYYVADKIIPQLIEEIKLRKEIIKTIDLCIPSVNFYIDDGKIIISNNVFMNCDKCCNTFLHKCDDQFAILNTYDCKINCIYGDDIHLSFNSVEELILNLFSCKYENILKTPKGFSNLYFRLFMNVSQKIVFQNYDIE